MRCDAAVAEKPTEEAAEEKFEYQAEVRYVCKTEFLLRVKSDEPVKSAEMLPNQYGRV